MNDSKKYNILIMEASMIHLEQILFLFQKYREFYKVELNSLEEKKFIKERMEKSESKIFLAMEENKAVGFTQLYPSYSSVSLKPVWILNDLYVEETYRKSGIGYMLLDAAKEFAIKTKSKGLTLMTGIENESAQNLYEKYGFIRNDHFYNYFLFF